MVVDILGGGSLRSVGIRFCQVGTEENSRLQDFNFNGDRER